MKTRFPALVATDSQMSVFCRECCNKERLVISLLFQRGQITFSENSHSVTITEIRRHSVTADDNLKMSLSCTTELWPSYLLPVVKVWLSVHTYPHSIEYYWN